LSTKLVVPERCSKRFLKSAVESGLDLSSTTHLANQQ